MIKDMHFKVIMVALVVLAAFGIAANNETGLVRIHIGGGMEYQADGLVLDKEIPFSLPVDVEYAVPFGGCGGTSTQRFHFAIKGTAKVFYDSNTGENYLRFPDLHYELTLRPGDAPKVEQFGR